MDGAAEDLAVPAAIVVADLVALAAAETLTEAAPAEAGNCASERGSLFE